MLNYDITRSINNRPDTTYNTHCLSLHKPVCMDSKLVEVRSMKIYKFLISSELLLVYQCPSHLVYIYQLQAAQQDLYTTLLSKQVSGTALKLSVSKML